MISVDNLFTKQQWRELELINLLSQTSDSVYYKDICERLDCSIMTLQACVAHPVFMEGLGSITSEHSQLRISYEHQYGLRDVYQRALLESQALKMMSALFFDDFASLDDLAEGLFISLSTLKRLIGKTNIYLRERFNIKIATHPIRVVGKEHDIRLFYAKYFAEAYPFNQWPFEPLLNENNHGRLIHLMASLTEIDLDFSIFRYLKILSAVNLIRYLKGFAIGEKKKLSGIFLSLLSDSQEMQDLSHLFTLKFSLPLDEMALSEMFSNYLDEGLVLGRSLQVTNSQTESPGSKSLNSWTDLLSKVEHDTGLVLSNKYEVARRLHATVILAAEDINDSYLIYDYKREYLAFFKKHYTHVYHKLVDHIRELFACGQEDLADTIQNNLLYTLLTTWENLFLAIGETMRRPRLLVIERSYGSVGDFLDQYIGKFFDITVFDQLTIDTKALEKEYDVIVTDTAIGDCQEADVFFFAKLIPTVVVAKLNQYLKVRMGTAFDAKVRSRRES